MVISYIMHTSCIDQLLSLSLSCHHIPDFSLVTTTLVVMPNFECK